MPELGRHVQNSEPGDRFVFTDLEELDSIIAELELLEIDIVDDDTELRYAIDVAAPPAIDRMSGRQVRAYRESLELARAHSASMLTYVVDQLDKLRAARHAYAGTEASAVDRLHDAERVGP